MLATRCPGCGTVNVYLGTTKLASISLNAKVTRKLQVIPVKTFASVRSGNVRIVVTSSAKPVIIDGLGVSRI